MVCVVLATATSAPAPETVHRLTGAATAGLLLSAAGRYRSRATPAAGGNRVEFCAAPPVAAIAGPSEGEPGHPGRCDTVTP